MTNVDDAPNYYWYTPHRRIEGDYRVHWHNGKQYIRFTEEPSYEEIERLDLRDRKYGDMTVIGGER